MFVDVDDAAISIIGYLGTQVGMPAHKVEDGVPLAHPEYYRQLAQQIFHLCFEFGEEAVEPLADILELIEHHPMTRPTGPELSLRAQALRRLA